MATLNINLDNVQPLNTLLTGISQLGYSGNAGLFLKVNATEDGFEFSAAGSSGISIGDTITGGTAGRVLFEGATNILADSAGLKYSDSLGLEVEPTGLIVGGYTAGLNIKGADPTMRITTNGGLGFGIFGTGTLLPFFRTTNNWASVIPMGGINLNYSGWGFGGINSPSAIVHAQAVSATDTVMIAQGTTSQTGNLYENRLVGGTSAVSGWDANGNLFSNTSGGIQLATAATQKIAFWGANPIVQPTTAITAATYASVSGSFVKASDTFDGYSIGQVVKALRNEGLLA